jgi:hypothetical protein
MQGQQQRSLQKAQAALEVDMKRRRKGIAVIACLGNGKGLGNLSARLSGSIRLKLLDPAGGFVKNEPAGMQVL